MRTAYAARFWFTQGIEVFSGLGVSSPPPQTYRFALFTRLSVGDMTQEYVAATICMPQQAEFQLKDWSPSGEVAHYLLVNKPPDGWRWIAANGKIQSERI